MISAVGALLLSNVTITLPAEAKVLGSEMTLGEIAVIQGDSAQHVERLKSFSLGYAPSPEYSRVLHRWKLEQRLTKEFSDLELVLVGKSACRVWPSVAIVTAAELEAEARESLDAIFAKEDVEIRLAGKLFDEKVPVGVKTRLLESEPTTTAPRAGSWSVPVRILIDGVPYRTVWTSFQVDLYRVMPVLRRDIAIGETITPGDMVMQRTAVSTSAGKKLLENDALIGAEAKRLLRAGLPVGDRDVKRVLAVERGDTVSLVVHNGQITVSTEVVALEDGHLGDRVPIQTFDSGKELTAKVVGKNRLELRLDSTH